MLEIRPITAADADMFRQRLSRGFGRDHDPGEESRERFDAIFELDRTLAAFDGAELVGTCAAFSLGVTVPGAREVAMGGTTVISVQPTHRRTGVLRSMMDMHLADIAAHGEPLAGLWASEGSIYGRFGYGTATYRHRARIDARSVSTRGPDGVTIHLTDARSGAPETRDVYEKARATGVGMLTRSDAWWEHRLLADPESWREGKSALRVAVARESGEATGYASYRQKADWDDSMATGEVSVEEMITTTDRSREALWNFLCNLDLFPRVDWWNMPLDDPLTALVADQRRVQRTVADALWIRLMDVPRALEARAYESEGSLTIATRDRSWPDAGGTFRLTVGEGVASCEPAAGSSPDVELEADVLGHLYLGGGNALRMAAAGRVEGDRGSVELLHRLFATAVTPWCPEVF